MMKTFSTILLVLAFSQLLQAKENREAEKVVTTYLESFLGQDWNELVAVMHPKMLAQFRDKVIGTRIPEKVEEGQPLTDKTKAALKILGVKTVEEAWALDTKTAVLRSLQYTDNTEIMRKVIETEIELQKVESSSKDGIHTVSVTFGIKNAAKKQIRSSVFTLEKLDGKLLVTSMMRQ